LFKQSRQISKILNSSFSLKKGSIALEWKLQQIPASFLIDQQGNVIAIDPGKEDIEIHLKNILR
jgi:hypothetical protein